jgi:RHS repeat-associated protein
VKTERWTGSSYNYTYAGNTQQELISHDTARGTKSYVYGRADQHGNPVVEQVTLDGETGYVERDPVTGEPLLLRTPTGMQSLYVYDGTGNPLALVTNGSYTATAYEYDPYGVPTLTEDSGGYGTVMNPYQFKGGLHDRNTNWVKFGHRWYSVEWGRFSQQDTLDAPLDPGNANRYAFAANDPINHADPLGLAYAKVTGTACFILCGEVAVGADGDPDLTLGMRLGWEFGADISAGGGAGTNEGAGTDVSCHGSTPLGGAYGEASLGQSPETGPSYGGGGGVTWGLRLGCSAGASYTF